MSAHTIHLRSETPDLLIEFDLPPGTHARIGASPVAEITLPLGGIPPLSGILGRFHDGRLFLASLDEAIASRLDLPATISINSYCFEIFKPADVAAAEIPAPDPGPSPTMEAGFSQKLRNLLSRFAKGSQPQVLPTTPEDGSAAPAEHSA